MLILSEPNSKSDMFASTSAPHDTTQMHSTRLAKRATVRWRVKLGTDRGARSLESAPWDVAFWLGADPERVWLPKVRSGPFGPAQAGVCQRNTARSRNEDWAQLSARAVLQISPPCPSTLHHLPQGLSRLVRSRFQVWVCTVRVSRSRRSLTRLPPLPRLVALLRCRAASWSFRFSFLRFMY